MREVFHKILMRTYIILLIKIMLLASEKIAGRAKAVVSSPAMLKISTCSPMDGAHHVRARPARMVSHLIGAVSSPPVCTRHRPFSVSTSEMVPIRIRLVSRRSSSESCVFIGTACHASCDGRMLALLFGCWHNAA